MKKPNDQDTEVDKQVLDQFYDQQKGNPLHNQFDKKASEQFHCQCDLCCYQRPLHYKTIPLSRRSSKSSNPQEKIPPQVEKDFVYILKRLQQPNKLVRGLRINIPEMFCLVQGDIKFLAHIGKEKLEKRDISTLKITKQKEKLTLPYLRKFLIERRNKTRVQAIQEVLSLRNSIIFSPFESGLTSVHVSQSMEPQDQQKWSESRLKEAVLIKYYDNNVQILTETECLSLMMKRRADPIWNQIQYVQNYVHPKKLNYELTQITFDYQIAQGNNNFLRAKKEISFLNADFSKASEDYISIEQEEEYEKQLLQIAPKEYCQYVVYKLVHYIEIFGASRVESGSFWFLYDRYDQWQLVNVDHLNAKELNNRPFFDMDAQNKGKKKRLFQKEEVEDKLKFDELMTIQRQYAASIYQDLMILEGQVKRRGVNQDMLKKNILAVAGEDVSNKTLMQVFSSNLSQFQQAAKPIDTLKQILFKHKIEQDRRSKLIQIKPITVSTSSHRYKRNIFNLSLQTNFTPTIAQTKIQISNGSILNGIKSRHTYQKSLQLQI